MCVEMNIIVAVEMSTVPFKTFKFAGRLEFQVAVLQVTACGAACMFCPVIARDWKLAHAILIWRMAFWASAWMDLP